MTSPVPEAKKLSSAYDLVIIGAGPAGLTAGLYAIRAGQRVAIVEQFAPGGQAASTWRVDNYPAVPEIHGAELMQRMEQQVREFGISILNLQVTRLIPGKPYRLETPEGFLEAGAVIIATGASPRPLKIPGEDTFRGRGVSYCATCDGAFFKEVPLAVIGGGNTALEEAEFLTRFASKIYLIHRRTEFRADRILQARILAHPKIETITPYIPLAIEGENGVSRIIVEARDVPGRTRVLPVKGVFIFVGTTPRTEFVKDMLELDETGFIRTRADLSTNHPGIFAAGDCRSGNFKQIVVAAGEGATAAMMADHYLHQEPQVS